ncbi:hypothetical protein BOTBODRAFT_33335 [Botryobasidium botryosum FD-172 SS1]|uniref:Nucleolar 27S pre-rRNA processing Urb2/Npa2 C-terminal domain-containing protein n=1 Tax=Botryobasidium botryosum (strain FD-172 SS1) TaxID=930990 RepID=A0A067MCX7_BOTB1|nr:hypothetical protein BOTBODRAFT_33335 [Botryobasidium botryosum FD-172 SS1]
MKDSGSLATSVLALSSSQSFIRALKAPADPPQPDGPSKIELARLAWELETLCVPSKAEVISEWILGKLLKEKGAERDANPILDVRYWSLLSEIIAVPKSRPLPSSFNGSATLRNKNIWLPPLLNRIPIVPILTTLVRNLPTEDVDFIQSVYQTLQVLLPLALPKANADAVVECFWEALAWLGRVNTAHIDEASTGIAVLVSDAFRKSFAQNSNKKKIYSSFVQSHLRSWSTALKVLSSASPALYQSFYWTGSEILFTLDILRLHLSSQKSQPKPEDQLFVQLSALKDPSILPSLLTSFTASLRKYKTNIFPAGDSSKSKLKLEAMEFFGRCGELLNGVGEQREAWEERLRLVEVVEKEGVFDETDVVSREKVEVYVPMTMAALGRQGDVVSAIKILVILARLDFSLISPFLSQLLSLLLVSPRSAQEPARELLLSLLAFHSKTRTLSTFISYLLSSLTFTLPAREAYPIVAAGPLCDHAFLTELNKAISTFLTPGQTLDTTKEISRILGEAWKECLEERVLLSPANSMPKKKKRRISEGGAAATTPPVDEKHAVRFALLCRLVLPILSSLPTRSLTSSGMSELQSEIRGLREDVILPAVRSVFLGPGGASTSTSTSTVTWGRQIADAAVLRLMYGLQHVRNGIWQAREADADTSIDLDDADADLVERMMQLLKAGDTLPELAVEICRTILQHCARTPFPLLTTPSVAIDHLLNYVESSLIADDGTSWQGRSSTLDSSRAGRVSASIALWDVIMDRWIQVLDEVATPAQRTRIAELLVRSHAESPLSQEDGLSAQVVFARSLQSGSFWELTNMRASLLAVLDKSTALFHAQSIPALLKQLRSSKDRHDATDSQLVASVAAFQLLLTFPIEYLGRQARAEFVKRALAADVILCSKSKGKKSAELTVAAGNVEWRTILRVFVERAVRDGGSVDILASDSEYIAYLGSSWFSPAQPSHAYTSVTLRLLEHAYLAAVRSSAKDEQGIVLQIIQRYMADKPFSSTASPVQRTIEQQSVLRLINVFLTHIRSLSDVSASVVNSLRALEGDIWAVVEPSLTTFTLGATTTTYDLVYFGHLIEASQVSLALSRWLGSTDDTQAQLGPALTSRIITFLRSGTSPLTGSEECINTCLALLTLLLEELKRSQSTHRSTQLEVILASYVVFASAFPDSAALGLTIGRGCKTLSVEDYEEISSLIQQAISSDCHTPEEDSALVRLADLALRNAPEGTSKISQELTSSCLRAFANADGISSNVKLANVVMDFILGQCTERAQSLRSLDLGSLWAILAQCLLGSTAHTSQSSPSLFFSTVSIITALVRLRRDLVIDTLPHLSAILIRLMSALRAVRPQLGAKQRRTVTDTLPYWINPDYPLGSDEAKAFARLLTSLTTKTVSRNVTSATDGPTQAQSLSQPFSKHAPYVFAAYVHAMTDPLCVLSPVVRRELEPGLFALCGMMGEYGRDSIMAAMLDAAGKIVMKVFWKEYEKQKYVGRG